MIDRIAQGVFPAQEIMNLYGRPPRTPNKHIVYEIACTPGARHGGALRYSRWRSAVMPEGIPQSGRRPEVEVRSEFFRYEPSPQPATRLDWHLNFAARDLFSAHDTDLFAQDELQVAEHPALAALRSALLDGGKSTLTVEGEQPTPILIAGVERRCAIAIGPDAGAGRPNGLYGNAFAAARSGAVRRATRALLPPTITNVLAMEAPPHGTGRYALEEIAFIFETAFVGFLATRLESYGDGAILPDVVVHTGYWGCGVYGGNRVLMPLLQLLAAHFAELDRLVFHTGSPGGGKDFAEALRLYQQAIAPPGQDLLLDQSLQAIEALGFAWGEGDGN